MEIQEYINQKKSLYNSLIDFISCKEEDTNEKFKQLIDLLSKQKIEDDRNEFQHFIELISNISMNYSSESIVSNKIEQIILHFSDKIKEIFTNSEIYNIFQNSKKDLLFLFDKEILLCDNSIIDQISKKMR